MNIKVFRSNKSYLTHFIVVATYYDIFLVQWEGKKIHKQREKKLVRTFKLVSYHASPIALHNFIRNVTDFIWTIFISKTIIVGCIENNKKFVKNREWY
jgi:hypothetical protein